MLDHAQTDLSPFERYNPKLFEGSSHTWALKWLDSLSSSARALDVGPGSGVMGKILRDQGIREIHAVEIDSETRQRLSGLYTSMVSSISELSENNFELVLLLDVLEHLTNPEEMLKDVLSKTAPEGLILISVPNIAHWSIRLSLLFGLFNYTNRGILDKTHFRFFTRRTLRSMLSRFGNDISVLQHSASIEPLELLLPQPVWNNELFKLISKGRVAVAGILPGLMAYQHLVAIKKN